ncbi:MerC domain-containing protein [Agarilytica rhodophyticola]|uniref:MerC domain-containing protein n=1 Tax=Agarilytica rhodophyticola TaxID=1737490 RepID=UPI001FE82C6A|nr:MerC domain-containing protein [Agarilytica rhodophyticola]
MQALSEAQRYQYKHIIYEEIEEFYKMINIQTFTDKAAIGLSVLCTLHCLALPLLLASLPSAAALSLNNEDFHLWMVLVVIPTSVYALTLGCKRHKKYQFIAAGSTGLTLLVIAVVLGESLLGETWEKILTVIGTAIIAYSHFKNFQLCQTKTSCACPKTANES